MLWLPVVTFVLWCAINVTNESTWLVPALLGGVVYGALVFALFGRRWLSLMRKRAHRAPTVPIDALEGVTPPPAGPDEQ